MKLTRRNFLAWASLSAVGAVACDIFREGEMETQSPVLQPEDLVKGQDNWYATLCRHCPSSHGTLVRVMEGRAKKIRGNPIYPINRGKQSARCDGGLHALYHPDRLPGPRRRSGPRGSGMFEPIDWPRGLDTLSAELQARGEGLLLITEPLTGHPGMIANRFANAFGGRYLGFDAFNNTVYSTAVKNVFGQDLLPDFDIANANYLLSFSADFLSTWVSPVHWAVGYGEFRHSENGEQRGTHIHVDPRFSMTAANADKWVPIRPGMEGYLAMSLAQVILAEGLQAPGVDVNALTGGAGAGELEAFSPERIGPMLELPEGMLAGQSPAEFIRTLARDLAQRGPSLVIGGDSAAAHSNGLFNLEAIYALNYLVGSVGQEGGIRFNPPSPLPNLPAQATVGSLQDWVGIASDLSSGSTRMLLVHGADPVYGLPNAAGFRDALDREDSFIVSFSPFMDETTVMADLILPDRIYLEDWGSDIPNPAPGYEIIGMQQPVVNPVGDLDPQSFYNVLLTVAQELGREAELPWANLQVALRESSDALFGMGRGSVQGATSEEFCTNMLRQGGWWDEGATGPVPSAPNGLLSQIAAKAAAPRFSGEGFYLAPFSHNTLLDGRNTHIPWAQGAPDPVTTITWQTWAEMNERQMREMGLREGDAVQVESSQGVITVPVYPNPAMPPNVVGVPLGQGRQHSPTIPMYGDSQGANVISILGPSQVEGTGALAWASNRARISSTGQSIRIPKFEGDFTSREIGNQIDPNPGEEIIKTVTPDGGE
jgi:menaquinone reductase, molybdopterin-binding-like subunit